MFDIISNRITRALKSNQGFGFWRVASFEFKPVKSGITLVLVSLAEVPPEDEMLGNIINTWSHKSHRNVMPRHSTIFGLVKLVILPITYTLKVHDTIVVEVLARKDGVLGARR